VSLDGGALKLTANEVSLLGIVAHGAGTLGFDADQASTPAVGLQSDAATTPANGHVAIDLHFSLDVLYGDGQVKTRAVTLTDAQIGNNATLSGLAADLSAALTGSGIQAAAESGHLVFNVVDTQVVQITLHGGSALGFDADQVSARQGDRLFSSPTAARSARSCG